MDANKARAGGGEGLGNGFRSDKKESTPSSMEVAETGFTPAAVHAF
jgi:hypothetical protein